MGDPEVPKATLNVIIASQNPVKIRVTLEGFSRMFPDFVYNVSGIHAESNVPEQPFSDDQTLSGALNRSTYARSLSPDADFWVGIEGGVERHVDSLQSFAWVVVIGKDGRIGKARTATYYLPKETVALLNQGMELGHADDHTFGISNSKQRQGSVGLLTGNVIDRFEFYLHAVILALIPFKQTNLTFEKVQEP